MDAFESKRMSQPGIDISSRGHGFLGFPYGVLSRFCYVLPIGKDRFECIIWINPASTHGAVAMGITLDWCAFWDVDVPSLETLWPWGWCAFRRLDGP